MFIVPARVFFRTASFFLILCYFIKIEENHRRYLHFVPNPPQSGK